ncbi:CRE-EPG-5 protein, partial [Aphelenchoides avenae]
MEEVRVKKPKPKTRRGRQDEPPPLPPHATAAISPAEFATAIEQLPTIDGLAPLDNRESSERKEDDNLPTEPSVDADVATVNGAESTCESQPSSKEQSASPAPEIRRPTSAAKSREASPSVPSPAAVAKERESRTSPNSTVRELPLEALIPRAGSREELDVPPAPVTMPPAVAPSRPIYPALNGVASATEKPPLPATRPPTMILPQISVEAVREAPPPPRMQPQYPKLVAAGEATAPSRTRLIEVSGESELLSEGQLLEYYQNEQLDFVDDFVDVFIEQELEPRNLLFELLERYKHVCDELGQSQDSKMRTAQELAKVNNEVWSVHDRKVTQQGKCGDDRSAAGEAFYRVAQLVPEKLVELQEKLSSLTSHELDQSICLEIQARALALLIQWTIVDINNRFLGDHQVSANSMPALLGTAHSLPSRRVLRGALSDLFYFLRFAVLPKRFRESVCAWITEAGSVMLKACSTDDQMFLLCQILRVPSPLGDWAAPLIQTFISIPCMDIARPMDSFVALLSLLLEPIRYREEFLNRIVKYYEGDNSWNLITEDGEADNSMLAQMSETDLVTILSQFCIRSLFSVAVKHFTYIHQGNRRQVLLSLVSFALIVLKLLDLGLKTYNGFKNFSKKLSDYIRKAVQYICAYWNLSKDQLLPVDRLMLQNEINRVVLQGMYYIVSKKSVGLWQFLVDFPYGTVTENCRMRCQILLRNSATTSVQKLYDIPDAAVAEHLKAGGSLADRMSDVGKEDTTYMLSALAAVISHSESEINHFVNEIIDVCFLDENTREQYYKVGSEAMSVVIERCPQMLSHVLRYIDRRIDHLDQYAVDILTNAPLSNCSLSKEDVGSLLGKWLINRPVNHPASHIARRVLTSMNWGTPSQLWIPQEVHDACADTIVKAHIVQCKSRNSLIAKSVSKAAKLATKCPDLEQQFDKFCWDVLLRLKITEKPATKPTNDLTAFFVYLVQKCMATPEAFLESGMHYFAELVNSTCFNAAVVILSRVVGTFPTRMHLFTANTPFRDCVERLIHADESHYAVQILMGADKFPGPVLRLVASAIAYQISMAPDKARKKDLSMAWMYVLTCKKTVDWNMDKFVLYLIGSVTKAAVANDPEELFGLVDVVTNLYKALFQAWKDAPRGPLSWFSSQAPPPLIASSLLTISPWASFLLLRAEPRIYSAFYTTMNSSLGKYPSRTLDEAVKKASSKAHVAFTVDRLDYYRWLELCVAEGVSDHHCFPLILQQLCIAMFTRKDYEGKKHCPGSRFFASPISETLFAKLRNDILPRAEKAAENERLSGFYHAVAQWLFMEGVYRADFTAYGDLILDYLLQMIVSGDTHLWTEFLETSKLRSSIKHDCKIYSMTCHLEDMPTAARLLDPARQFESMTKLFAFLDAASDTQPFPLVPIHQSLPAREQMDAVDACNATVVYSKFSAHLEELNKAARFVAQLRSGSCAVQHFRSFIDGKEKVERLNSAYLELFQKLYTDHQSSIQVTLRCGNFISSKCARPTQVNTVVTSSHYDQATATQMNDNRQKREEEVGRLLTTLDATAITSSHLEYICGLLHGFATAGQGKIRGDQLRATGLRLFYGICNAVGSFNLLFPAATAVYEACLRKLGKAFLQENASEQVNLMRVVLSGNPLNHFLVEHFTPHCVPPAQLFQLYAELSASVRNATTSEAALSLLSRLDIAHAGEQMPPNQFSSLMPVIFENLASVTGNESPLKRLCMDHFVHAMFHQFPYNFTHGLRLILSGCDSNVVPPSLFAEVSSQLSID